MVPQFVNEIVGWIPGMTGIFISCVFSAALSTMSAFLNTVGAVMYNDYVRTIRGFNHTDKRARTVMKLTVAIIGVYSVLCGVAFEKIGSLFQFGYTVNSINLGAVCGVFTLGMFNTRANQKGAYWGGIACLVTMAWVVIKCSIQQRRGEYTFEPLPKFVDGCTEEFINNITTFILQPVV